jgi:hypothetical protein
MSPSSSSSSSSAALLVAGTWKRLFEEEPIGNTSGRDTTTLVLWTQARESGIYVDIRLPLQSPGRSSLDATVSQSGIQPRPSALAATGFSQQAKTKLKEKGCLDILLQQKSFAGVITVQPGDTTETGGLALQRDAVLADLAAKQPSCNSNMTTIPLCTCFWRRDLDYQPPTLDLDIGVCISVDDPQAAATTRDNNGNDNVNDDNGSIVMRETGANGTYAEAWQRLPHTANGPFMALELQAENDDLIDARQGYWVRAGRCFAYAVGRPTTSADSIVQNDESVGKSLAQAVEHLYAANADTTTTTTTNIKEDKVLDLVDSYVGLTGEIDDSNGQWRIQHSTNPELVGCLLLVGGSSGSKDDDAALCCSELRLTPTTGGEGESSSNDQVVEQIIFDDDGGPSVKRRWKVMELSGCSLPTSLKKA